MNVDLSTRYLGLTLRNPLIASACPLNQDPEFLLQLEEAGAAAAVFPSLFEEQIEFQQQQIFGLYEYGTESFAESLSYFPELEDYNVGPTEYLRRLRLARETVRFPLIGSLNGMTVGGWIHFAKLIEDTGVDALELNVYFVPTDARHSGEEVERRYLDLVTAVRKAVRIPLAVKVGPYFTSFGHFARRLVDVGADGLTIFNRYVQPDIDLETLDFFPNLMLSESYESRLSMTWIAMLRGRIGAYLAATSGIHEVADLVKLLLVGADAAMLASAVYRHGPAHFTRLEAGLRDWLVEKDYASVGQMKGSLSRENCPTPEAFERVNYMRSLVAFSGKAI
ncbi:MAG TPA: dihydroorotate dehydrogenase-like protein [Candidatus Krumholzibacteria bacterium]